MKNLKKIITVAIFVATMGCLQNHNVEAASRNHHMTTQQKANNLANTFKKYNKSISKSTLFDIFQDIKQYDWNTSSKAINQAKFDFYQNATNKAKAYKSIKIHGRHLSPIEIFNDLIDEDMDFFTYKEAYYAMNHLYITKTIKLSHGRHRYIYKHFSFKDLQTTKEEMEDWNTSHSNGF